MQKYLKVVEFLNGQLEKSKADHHAAMLHIWKEKRILIDEALFNFSRIYEAHCLKKPGEFETALDNTFLVTQDNASNPPEIEPSEPDHLYKPEAVLFCLQEMLKPDYSPPTDNFTGIQSHLTALWVFYHVLPSISPKSFPLSVVMRLDLAFIKLFAAAEVLSIMMIKRGYKQDSDYEKVKRSAGGKRLAMKQRYDELINEALRHIDPALPNKNQKTQAILKYILKNYGNEETPSFNTIYGRL